MKILSITQARMGSTRLPKKVLMEVLGESLIDIHNSRVSGSSRISDHIVATSLNSENDELEKQLIKSGFKCFRGSEHDVLDRYYHAAITYEPDYIVRLTGDCPLVDPKLIDAVIDFTVNNNLDYGSNTMERYYPDGQDIEVFKFKSLEKAFNEAKLPSEREHVTPFIWKNSTFYNSNYFVSDNFRDHNDKSIGEIRMTVDEREDFELIKILIEKLGADKPWKSYCDYLMANPSIRNINSHLTINEGYNKSLENDV